MPFGDTADLYDARIESGYTLACAYLQRGPLGLDLDLFKAEYIFAAAVMASQFPCIGDPKALTSPDSIFFDRAAALIVSARLLPVVTQGGAGGTVLSMATADGTKETYAPVDPASPAKWIEEASESLFRVSCLSASLTSAASTYSTSMLAPARRNAGGYNALAGYSAFFWGFLDYNLYPVGSAPYSSSGPW